VIAHVGGQFNDCYPKSRVENYLRLRLTVRGRTGIAMTTIWIKKEKDARDIPGLLAKAMAQRMPPEINERIMQRRFTVVPNTTDDRGGYFVVFPASPPRRWWQF
jgi:hypothetical protein